MRVRRHNSVETNDAHPVNRIYLQLHDGKLYRAGTCLFDVTFLFPFLFNFHSYVNDKSSMFFIFSLFKMLVNTSSVTNMNVVSTQNSHERIIFYKGYF